MTKIRVWNKIVNKFIQFPDRLAQDKDGIYYRGVEDSLDKDYCPRAYQVVQRFTGLKDKNNKDIYEGDVVSVEGLEKLNSYWSSNKYKIAYSLDAGGDFPFAGFTVINLSPTDLETGVLLNSVLAQSITVLGNVFETSE